MPLGLFRKQDAHVYFCCKTTTFFFVFASLLLKKYTILCNTEQELHKIAIIVILIKNLAKSFCYVSIIS